MQAGELRNKIDFYKMESRRNEIGQDKRVPVIYREGVWAKIVPQTGTQQNLSGDVKATSVTHKITVRRGLDLKNDMVIKYKGQQYRVKYWQPVYNNTDFIEILAELEQNV